MKLATITAVTCMLFLAACSSYVDVSALQQARSQIGREFELTHDIYLIQGTDYPSKFPQLRAHSAGILGLSDPALPKVVSRKNIGAVYAYIRVIGVLAAGSRLKIQGIYRYSEPTDHWFEIRLTTSDPSFPMVQLNVRVPGEPNPIPDDFSQRPWFFSVYAREINPSSKHQK